MGEAILLVGFGKTALLETAEELVRLGYRPLARSWRDFSPTAFGKGRRPGLILVDADQPSAASMPEFCDHVRQYWGETFPIIAISASTKFSELSLLLDAGASDCLRAGDTGPLMTRKITRCLADVADAGDEDEDELPGSLTRIFSRPSLFRLGDLASVYPGAAPRKPSYRRLAPPDDDWRGVLSAAAVGRFLAGKPDMYLRWSRLHLFRLPAPEEYAVQEKVLLRRAGPPLAAAVDRSRLPAGNNVYSLVPRDGIAAGYLACILNSRLMDFYFNRLASLGEGGFLRLEDVREAPIPRPSTSANQELSKTAALLAHYGPNPQNWVDKQSKDELWERMEDAVFELYGADREARSGLAALHF